MQINKKYLNLYFNFLKKYIYLKNPLKVVFDSSDGVMGLILQQILPKIKNLNYILINKKPNGNFPHHGPDPTKSKALSQLKKIVLKNKANLGIAFDGDGDRAIFVSEKGKKVETSLIGYLLIQSLKKTNKKIVFDILIYEGLKYLKLLPKKYFLSQIGTNFLKETMKKYKADLGIEHSGHFYFKEADFKDDSLIAVFKILSYLSHNQIKIEEYQKLIKFNLKTKQKNIKITNFNNNNFTLIENFIVKKYKNYLKNINRFEGLTFEFKNSFLNIRKSNTENFLRIYTGEIF